MKAVEDLPNIGSVLAEKLHKVGIHNEMNLKQLGSMDAIIRISALPNSGICHNMLYALEGAVQGIRWHSLTKLEKDELGRFLNQLKQKQTRLNQHS